MSFETLDPEQMNNTTMKYAKSVMQLEKGLPPNGVVPMLKERVETMRDRVGHSGKEKYQIFVILQDLYDKKHNEFFFPYLIIISPYSSQWLQTWETPP